MSPLSRTLPLILAVAAAPAFAAPPDQHATHHPADKAAAAAAKPAPKAAAPGETQGCPMMEQHMGAQAQAGMMKGGPGGGPMAQGAMMQGGAMKGGAMTPGGAQGQAHCMQAMHEQAGAAAPQPPPT